MNVSCEFTKKYSVDERIQKVNNMRQKFPTKVPIVIIFSKDFNHCTDKQFLIDSQMTLGNFICILRKQHIQLKPSEAIFCLINNILPPITELIVTLYTSYASSDGILYIHIKKESTFG